MKRTLDKKIEELKQNALEMSPMEMIALAEEIHELSSRLGCELDVLMDLHEFFDLKREEYLANNMEGKERRVLDIIRTEYRDVIHLEVDEKLDFKGICELIKDVRPDYAERFVGIELGCTKGSSIEDVEFISLNYEGRKDLVIQFDLTDLSKLDIFALCSKLEKFLS